MEIWRENSHVIREVRALGLMIGVEYKYEFLGALHGRMPCEAGGLGGLLGNAPEVMRFQIPITARVEEVDELLACIRAAVNSMKIYLVFLLPLARIPMFRMILDNLKVQITTFNLIRDLEEFVSRYVLKAMGFRG